MSLVKMAPVLEKHSPKKLADVFAEDSEDDGTFYGFSDTEIKNGNLTFEDEDEAQTDMFPKDQKAPIRPSAAAAPQPFRLRVALRSAPLTQQSTDEDDDDDDDEQVKEEEEEDAEEEKKKMKNRGVKRARKGGRTKKETRVKFEDELETAVARTSPPEESAEDASDNFLAKRAQNIKANKAMLAQLMADLQKMPGGAGLLQKQAAKQKAKVKGSRPPRSGATGGEARRNPDRASRRQTRSMGTVEDSSASQEAEVELSLEDELLQVRGAPRRRATPRPNTSKPHVIRPVEDITEDEIQLVADNMTDKVYNTVTGSTCHQCRQKTVDTKTFCRSEDCRGIQGQFCGPCLRNRYGEDVRKALLDPEWKCPPCRGICNCSFCRQREGRCPTGILFPLAQYHGFSDVHSYLSSLRNKLKSEENDVEM